MKTPHLLHTHYIKEVKINPSPFEIGFYWNAHEKKRLFRKPVPVGLFFWDKFLGENIPDTMYLEDGMHLRHKPRIELTYDMGQRFYYCDTIELAEARMLSISRSIRAKKIIDINSL